MISAGEFVQATGTWINDRAHGPQFKASFLRAAPPTTLEGIEKYLGSFAQFERELAGERIRDKFAASRRKGIFMGGVPPLGYDVRDRKLVVNPAEADLVRLIFQRFVDLGSALLLIRELNAQGYRTKSWTTQAGTFREGRPFDKGTLYKII